MRARSTNKTQGHGRIVMKKLFICLILATLGCSLNSQSKSVVLDSNKHIGHIYLNGTVTVSGDHSVVYLGKDDFGNTKRKTKKRPPATITLPIIIPEKDKKYKWQCAFSKRI